MIAFALGLSIVINPMTVPTAAQTVIDRTLEREPLVVTRDTDMSDVTLVDYNPSRPAIVLVGCSLKIAAIVRPTGAVHSPASDPGLGVWFDGTFLPKLQIEFSHHDFDRASVAALGSVKIDVGSMICDTGISLTALPDGTYGKNSVVKIDSISGFRFGVLATGQEKLDVRIGTALAALWPADAGEGPGHAFYANESRLSATGEFLRLKGVTLRIGTSRAVAKAAGVRADHVTAKFKGSWGVDYECLDDQNPCGALDQYGSYGTARIVWIHPGIDAQNPVFSAFRIGGEGGFGTPPGKFVVTGTFDSNKCPDQTVPRFRWETPKAAASLVTCAGGGLPVVWPGSDVTGVGSAMVIQK